ncbi:MAG: sodium/pantothenate symporter [Lachnospiraceae bacterium]|nr:sodium/pantothenate symporter [Lachnospiraceae bacterium]
MTSNQIIMLSIIIIYLIVNVIVGMVYSKRKDSQSDMSFSKKYFIGSRGMNGVVLAMTTVATYASVSSFISGPGAAAMTYGFSQAWVSGVQIGAAFLTLGVLGKKFAIVSRKTGAVTVAGYLKARYKSDVLVVLTTVLMLVFFVTQMIAQFIGGATLIETVTGLPYWAALAIFAVVVILYTAFGGFTAVVITDTIQGVVMLIGTFLFIFYVLKNVGSFEAMSVALDASLPGWDNLTGTGYTPGALLSFWVLVGIGVLGLPQTAVRGMGFKDTKSCHSAMLIGTIVVGVLMIGMHTAGVWAGALTGGQTFASTDYFIPTIIQQIMPVGAAGLFLAAPMAAVMSTVSSLLILASASIVKDLWGTYIVKDDPVKKEKFNKNLSKSSLLITLLIGVLVFVMTLTPPDIIFFINLFAMGGLESCFFWPIVGGIFYKKGNNKAAIASTLTGVITYVISYQFKITVFGINAVVWGILFGGIAYFLVGELTCKNGLDQDVLEKCF